MILQLQIKKNRNLIESDAQNKTENWLRCSLAPLLKLFEMGFVFKLYGINTYAVNGHISGVLPPGAAKLN